MLFRSAKLILPEADAAPTKKEEALNVQPDVAEPAREEEDGVNAAMEADGSSSEQADEAFVWAREAGSGVGLGSSSG